MALLNLIDSFGQTGANNNLFSASANIVDTDYLSKYFVVSEFNRTFTSGKNCVAINGSPFLSASAPIQVQCLDSQGNSLYIQQAQYSDDNIYGGSKSAIYNEAGANILAIYVFGDTNDGVGQLILRGTLSNGQVVKWTQNIVINKTLSNASRVRFYQTPIINIESTDIPLPNNDGNTQLISNQQFSGIVQGLPVTPVKGTNLATLNLANTNVDYRLTLISPTVDNNTADVNGFNSQMIGSTITLYVNKIISAETLNQVSASQTASFVISDVLTNNVIQISSPYYNYDFYNNSIVTTITNANFTVEYSYTNYNNQTASYQQVNIGGIQYTIYDCYADVSYQNIRTFSGYVARHKLYRKSLLTDNNFTLVADEPIIANDMLLDTISQNKYYSEIGTFYNSDHISRYWLTSSNQIVLQHVPNYAINTMYMFSPDASTLSGSAYTIVKNYTINTDRNAQYVPFDEAQFLEESGSSYDSNFIHLNANTQYVIEISAVIEKETTTTDPSSLVLYFTSSITASSQEPNYTPNYGIRLAYLSGSQTSSLIDYTDSYTFYTPKNDLYGTLVLVPYYCNAYIKNISFRVYGDDGFSPDVFNTQVSWPVTVANEPFQIKAELFDINSTLVYSDLNIVYGFDPSGSSILPTNNLVLPISSSANKLIPYIQTGSIYFYDSGSINLLYVYNGLKWVSSSFH